MSLITALNKPHFDLLMEPIYFCQQGSRVTGVLFHTQGEGIPCRDTQKESEQKKKKNLAKFLLVYQDCILSLLSKPDREAEEAAEPLGDNSSYYPKIDRLGIWSPCSEDEQTPAWTRLLSS